MKLRRTSICIALGTAGAAACGAAAAQDMRINVTGTNIKRIDTETAAPIETITREDIQASGLQTISDVVRQITANNNGTIGPSFTNGFSVSGSAVSLRGLGPNNTLVLLNGRRLANFGLADDSHISYVDLQQIPFDAVERIEVLKDGASAIYGADAVAGVVNVILRQQYTGLTMTATAGTNYNGEGNQYKGAITMGVGDLTKDRYNLFLTIDGQKQQAIPATSSRDYMGTNDLRFMDLPDLRPGGPGSLFGPPSLLGNVRPVPPTGVGQAGLFQPLSGPCADSNLDSDGFCRWDPKWYMDLLPDIERFNVYARGTWSFADAAQAYAEASVFKVRTDTRLPPPSTRSIWYNPAGQHLNPTVQLYLPVGHPDNPFNGTGRAARLFYADGALGGLTASFDTTTQRYLAGVKGTHAGWDWDAAALYIRSNTDAERQHVYSYSRLLQGLAGTSPYGYYRIGANAGLNDPAVYAWIAPSLAFTTLSENTIVDAKASRDIFKLEGGRAALAIGYEFRRESLDKPGWPGADVGDAMAVDYVSVSGSRNVNAVFAELYAPLLRNLEITAAVRYDHYSDVGSTTNPKVGIKWTALPQLVLRGTYETAFRAPSIFESQPSTLGGRFGAADPVRCPVTGANADCNATFGGIIFGNPHVQPEKATTYTAGLILEPVPGLSATLDYWNIVTRNQITVADTQAILNNPAAYPTSNIIRDSNDLPGIPNSGSILLVSTLWENGNSIKTDGIDVDLRARWTSRDWGTLSAELQWTHVFKYVQTFAAGDSYDYVGTAGNYGVSSAGGTPQDRVNLILGWTRGSLSVTGTVRYVSDYQSTYYKGYEPPPGSDSRCVFPIETPDCHVASFTTLDLSASYSEFKNWQIFGSIINVFNRMAPFSPGAAYGGVNYNYNWAYSGATGTQFNLGFRYTFE